MTPFTYKAQYVNGSLVLSTEGYINQTAGEQISESCKKYIADSGKQIVLDLKGSKIINSVGISHILEVIELINSQGGKLTFVNLDAAVEKTLTIMGIFQFAGKAESVDAALMAKKLFKLS
jgi:anti-anti-sigma factor